MAKSENYEEAVNILNQLEEISILENVKIKQQNKIHSYKELQCQSWIEQADELYNGKNKKGKKVGCITVHLYRPFAKEYLFRVMPKTVKRVAVLDRTKEPGALGEPLYLDVKAAYYGVKGAPTIIGGRYGLSSKDTTPAQMIAVFDHLKKNGFDGFTVGIEDDVTHLSIPVGKELKLLEDLSLIHI